MNAKDLANNFVEAYNQHVDEPEYLINYITLVIQTIILYSETLANARHPQTNYDWSKIVDECNSIWKAFVKTINKMNLQYKGTPITFKPEGYILYIQKNIPEMYLTWHIVNKEVEKKRRDK